MMLEDAASQDEILLPEVAHGTAQEKVENTLRQAILSGQLSPGSRLVLSRLSRQLGVSRTPIREAMRTLASEGLIDLDSFRSATVHTPTVEEAREIYDLRLVLEPIAVRSAVDEITEAQLQEAESLHGSMLSVSDHGEWVRLNREFHRVLLSATGSKRLREIIGSLRNAATMQVARSLRADRAQVERSNRDHEQILAAFRSRDADSAAELTKRHLTITLKLIEEDETSRSLRS